MSAKRNLERKLQIFTTMPPPDAEAEAVEFPHVGEHELDLNDETAGLITKRDSFLQTGNPVLAIEAFVLACRAGLYPPTWVAHFLAERFQHWHNRQGRSSLDTLLGLRPGRGRDPAFKRLFIEERNEILTIDMARLVALGATIDEAATMCAERLKNTENWNQSGWSMKSIDVPTLRKLYRASTFKGNGAYYLNRWSADQVRNWLRLFPSYSMPETLKKLATK